MSTHGVTHGALSEPRGADSRQEGKGREGKGRGGCGEGPSMTSGSRPPRPAGVHPRTVSASVMDGGKAEDDDGGWHCAHDWLLRPESDTWECLICGVER